MRRAFPVLLAGLLFRAAVSNGFELDSLRCGETCHTNDAIRGGFHDAPDSGAVRADSMIRLVHALNLCLELEPDQPAMRDALHHALDWCIAALQPDGIVPEGLEPDPERSSRRLIVRERASRNLSYAAALARSCRLLVGDRRRDVLTAAESAFVRAMRQPVLPGDRAAQYAAARALFRATDDPVYGRVLRELDDPALHAWDPLDGDAEPGSLSAWARDFARDCGARPTIP